ncbi:MAG: Y-family DNA polymerase [Nitrospira sp.]|nr:Y-family DNA polymerase [Nitrospira sp.]MBS0194358.1 Y-family DNA polymerase [Pseudomonadota bacterium]
MFALVDCNNFYASCEIAWRPHLRGRPVVVLSNNDGCAIARSPEAKALGIKMGQPAHELRDLVRSGLVMCSANFTLYGDMSRRVVAILREQVPRLEVYSVDECFLDFRGIRDREAFAHRLRERVRRGTGINNCIGIAESKGLAKLANKIAKRGAGVVDLVDADRRNAALEDFPIADVWGVGPRWAAKLSAIGITTAAHLRDASPAMILERYGVTLLRTQRELQGTACLTLDEVEPDRQQIVVSRSFGERVEDHAAVAQALATFAVRAAEKLRKRGLVAAGVQVFASTDTFRPELRQHHPCRAMTLPTATSDSRLILASVHRMLASFLRRGCAYKRAGVALLDLARPSALQSDLFAPAVVGDDKLMALVDGINRRFGRGTAGFGATGWQARPTWGMRQRDVSPCYTTRWADLPIAHC